MVRSKSKTGAFIVASWIASIFLSVGSSHQLLQLGLLLGPYTNRWLIQLAFSSLIPFVPWWTPSSLPLWIPWLSIPILLIQSLGSDSDQAASCKSPRSWTVNAGQRLNPANPIEYLWSFSLHLPSINATFIQFD
jgi:hypothetical protein